MKISRLSDPLFVTGLALALLLMILDRFALLPFGAGVAEGGAPTGLLLAWAVGHCDTRGGVRRAGNGISRRLSPARGNVETERQIRSARHKS